MKAKITVELEDGKNHTFEVDHFTIKEEKGIEEFHDGLMVRCVYSGMYRLTIQGSIGCRYESFQPVIKRNNVYG